MNTSVDTARREWSILAWLQLAFAAGCFMATGVARYRLRTVGDDDRLEIGILLSGGTLILGLALIAFIVERAHRRQPKVEMLDAPAPMPGMPQHVSA